MSDEGTGFDPNESYPGHLGLRTMRERAEMIGAELEIVSAVGRGTRVRVRVPGTKQWRGRPGSGRATALEDHDLVGGQRPFGEPLHVSRLDSLDKPFWPEPAGSAQLPQVATLPGWASDLTMRSIL